MDTETVRLTRADGSSRTLEEIKMEVVAAAVVRCLGNRSRAARVLGIGRSTLYRKVEAAGPPRQPDRVATVPQDDPGRVPVNQTGRKQ